MTFTGAIGAVCMFPLRAIIAPASRCGIHPNMLTLIGVLINVGGRLGARPSAASSLAGVIMIVANIFDFIDGKVAHITGNAVGSSAGSGTRRSTASRTSRCSSG